jgi:hypothetical protein
MALLAFAFAVALIASHELPMHRIGADFAVEGDSPVLRRADLAAGQILVVRFPKPFGVFSMPNPTSCRIYATRSDSPSVWQLPDSLRDTADRGLLISMGSSSGFIEIVAMAPISVTVVGAYMGSCTEIRPSTRKFSQITRLSREARICYLHTSDTGSLTLSGTLGRATVRLASLSGIEEVSTIPEGGLIYSLSRVKAVSVSAPDEAEFNMSVGFDVPESEDATPSIHWGDPPKFGAMGAEFRDFVEVDGEPPYPPLGDEGHTEDRVFYWVVIGFTVLTVVLIAVGSVTLMKRARDQYVRGESEEMTPDGFPQHAPKPETKSPKNKPKAVKSPRPEKTGPDGLPANPYADCDDGFAVQASYCL